MMAIWGAVERRSTKEWPMREPGDVEMVGALCSPKSEH